MKVLIVEDDPILQSGYKKKLESEGMKVETAQDGSEAIKKANSFKPDVILLDILMPGVSGLEFLRRFDPKKHPEVKIVVFSALSLDEVAKQAITLGAHKFLPKPMITPTKMVSTIKEIAKKK